MRNALSLLMVLFFNLACEKHQLLNDVGKNEASFRINKRNYPGVLPKTWFENPINAELEEIDDVEFKRVLTLVKEAIKVYKSDVLNQNLKELSVFKSIKFYGLEYGGTNSNDKIYLTSMGLKEGFSDEYIINSFHHEFSSILLRNYSYPEKEWLQVNPKSFKYLGDGVQALREKKTGLKGSDEYYKDGFLSEYSQASFEEDFNVYSAEILTDPEKFDQVRQAYPLVQKKYEIWKKFYKDFLKN